MNRAGIFISHVASQLMYKWIEPKLHWEGLCGPLANLSGMDIEDLTYQQWRSILVDERGLPNLQLTWLEAYLRRSGGSYDKLVGHCLSHLRSVKEARAKIILVCDPEYPPLLGALKDPPLCITALGNSELLEFPKISMVGSRNACGRAIAECRELGGILAREGFVVVSGGAYGCDIAAHKGVLAGGLLPARAIVVFAGGLNALYPGGNMGTFRNLLKNGALFLSERLWEAPSRPFDFPVRNRIVSGLSRETVVMQAAVRSGAMVTAQLALEQGRDVSVLSYLAEEESAHGSNQLLADGAHSFHRAAAWFDRHSSN